MHALLDPSDYDEQGNHFGSLGTHMEKNVSWFLWMSNSCFIHCTHHFVW